MWGSPWSLFVFRTVPCLVYFVILRTLFANTAILGSRAPPESMKFTRVPNPVSGMELTKTLESFFPKTLSITGGEPLQHNDFLREWLPMVHPDYRILLETNGVLVEELRQVMDQVDIISMDMKLPSVTGMKDYWEEHEKFLKLAIAKEVYVKVVISSPTEEADLKKALAIVERYSPEIPFILQPATPFGPVRESVGPDRLRDFYKLSKSYLKNVRVIPQVHKQLGLL